MDRRSLPPNSPPDKVIKRGRGGCLAAVGLALIVASLNTNKIFSSPDGGALAFTPIALVLGVFLLVVGTMYLMGLLPEHGAGKSKE